MGKKIFVSYKYSDSNVQNLPGRYVTTARHYVDKLQELLEVGDHINKGENDGESLDTFIDEAIWTTLKEKIYDSSVTIVLISKGMKDSSKFERDQWIPWEISYSLKEVSRDGRTSKTNAILAVVLPDQVGSYEYFFTYNSYCGSTNHNIDILFKILKKNMFNIKNPDTRECNGSRIYNGYFSYIHCVRWDTFIGNINAYVGIALQIWGNREQYDITKAVD